ncbi:hypothetical protein O9992_18240 [Vibrio lentus]|nr:hypothetical protein [Vibrio lentus]
MGQKSTSISMTTRLTKGDAIQVVLEEVTDKVELERELLFTVQCMTI